MINQTRNAIFVHYELSRPKEVQKAMAYAPVAWVPFGALEWHGEHNPLGLDGLKAHELLRRAAQRAGGVLFPPVFWGAMNTMGFPFTFRFPKKLLTLQTRLSLEQLYGIGFRVMVLLSGHYPPRQIKMLRQACTRFNKKYDDAFAIGIPEQALATDIEYFGDHAAMWETSIMMALFPDLVDLTALPKDLNYRDQCQAHGVVGINPLGHASKELGQKAVQLIVSRLAQAVTKVLKTNSAEPFRQIYKNYDRDMKKVLNPGRGKKILGAPSLTDTIRVLVWGLGGSKQKKPR